MVRCVTESYNDRLLGPTKTQKLVSGHAHNSLNTCFPVNLSRSRLWFSGHRDFLRMRRYNLAPRSTPTCAAFSEKCRRGKTILRIRSQIATDPSPPPPHPLQKKNQVQERSQKLHICTLFFEQSIMHGSIFCGTNPFPLSLLAHHQLFGIFYRVASIAIPVRKWVIFDRFLFFSVSVKVLPVTPMLSSVFVHRTLCAYFLRIKGVVEMLRIFNLICNGVGSLVTRMVF